MMQNVTICANQCWSQKRHPPPVSQAGRGPYGVVGAQRREAQPTGEAEKQRSVPFSAHCEIVKTKCLSFEWQLNSQPACMTNAAFSQAPCSKQLTQSMQDKSTCRRVLFPAEPSETHARLLFVPLCLHGVAMVVVWGEDISWYFLYAAFFCTKRQLLSHFAAHNSIDLWLLLFAKFYRSECGHVRQVPSLLKLV